MLTRMPDADRLQAARMLPLLEGGPADMALLRGRVHEVCGPARRTLAAMAMGRVAAGTVLWILPAWLAERPMPAGLQAFADPGRLILVAARRPEDILWAMEEGLRAGAVPLVVAEVVALPSLTQMRRLQLATEAGAAIAGRGPPPLGLVLTQGEGGAAGAESRWHMAPTADGGWHLDRPRARAAMPVGWVLTQDGRGRIRAARREGAVA